MSLRLEFNFFALLEANYMASEVANVSNVFPPAGDAVSQILCKQFILFSLFLMSAAGSPASSHQGDKGRQGTLSPQPDKGEVTLLPRGSRAVGNHDTM